MRMRFGLRKKMLNIQVEPRICRKTKLLAKIGPPKPAFSTGGFADLDSSRTIGFLAAVMEGRT